MMKTYICLSPKKFRLFHNVLSSLKISVGCELGRQNAYPPLNVTFLKRVQILLCSPYSHSKVVLGEMVSTGARTTLTEYRS